MRLQTRYYRGYPSEAPSGYVEDSPGLTAQSEWRQMSSLNARTLVLVGFDSRICLGTTAIDAMYRNYRVIALRDCTSTGEYVETAAEGWTNWMAIRFIESAFLGNTA